MLEGILSGLQTAFSPVNLLMVFAGCFAGTFIGMLPGLGPVSAIALMIPITYGLDPASGLILIAGGIFLLYKSTTEIHHKLEDDTHHGSEKKKGKTTLSNVIVQITIINIVFSFDSILTAVGMTNGLNGALLIMIIAVVLSVAVMMAFANPVQPTMIMQGQWVPFDTPINYGD